MVKPESDFFSCKELNPNIVVAVPNGVRMMPIESNRSAWPYGLMRLSDMINCGVQSLFSLGSQLMLEGVLRPEKTIICPPIDSMIDAKQARDIKGWMKVAAIVAKDFELHAAENRIDRINAKVDKGITHRDLATELRVLKETIQDGMKFHLIYRYPNYKSEILMRWQQEWNAVCLKFPSSKEDIRAGVDLWAMSHYTASMFHMMRVLEHGLRALSLDLGLIYSTQNWYNIINEITKKISEQEKSLTKGDARAARLQFLSEAAKEFSYFKDGWRNYVSHAKCVYDEHQARSVMEHVRQFMTTLSRELSEVAEIESGQQQSQTSDHSHLHQAPERSQ